LRHILKGSLDITIHRDRGKGLTGAAILPDTELNGFRRAKVISQFHAGDSK
jgi:hypothetical protein